MNSRHSAEYAAWGTPEPIIAAARTVLGSFDLDPASDAGAQVRIRALRYFGVELNGLQQDWGAARTVFLNPPGGLVRPFWRRLLEWLPTDTLNRAIWIGYSLEQLQTLQTDGIGPTAAASAICYPSRRIAFLDANGVPKPSPTHANYIAFLGVNGAGRFRATFETFGEVR